MTAPVGVALVGFGYWGANLARNIASAPTTDLVAVADADATRRDAATAAFPGVKTWPALEEALDDATIDAVVIATPVSTHATLALRALDAGRHVLVEKPLALSVADAEKIVDRATELGLTAMVGHTFLYSSPVRKLHDIIVSGDIGTVQYLYSQRLSLGRIRGDCNALWNFAPHDLAIILYLLGERPSEVSARGWSFLQPGIDDVCFASLSFPSGIGANIHVSWIDPRKQRLMTIVGDDKMVVYDDVSTDRQLSIFDAGVARSENPSLGEYSSLGEFQWRVRAGDILIPKIDMAEPLHAEIEAFGSACQTGEPPLADARHGLEVVNVLAAIDESARQGGEPAPIAW